MPLLETPSPLSWLLITFFQRHPFNLTMEAVQLSLIVRKKIKGLLSLAEEYCDLCFCQWYRRITRGLRHWFAFRQPKAETLGLLVLLPRVLSDRAQWSIYHSRASRILFIFSFLLCQFWCIRKLVHWRWICWEDRATKTGKQIILIWRPKSHNEWYLSRTRVSQRSIEAMVGQKKRHTGWSLL